MYLKLEEMIIYAQMKYRNVQAEFVIPWMRVTTPQEEEELCKKKAACPLVSILLRCLLVVPFWFISSDFVFFKNISRVLPGATAVVS